MKKINNSNGFTLVELAIVMIIIGLLIGGVLKGQELIENAKATAVISEVKGYTAALHAFRDAYGGTPGDMPNATSRLRGCGGNTVAGNYCDDGDGNSLVGTSGINTQWSSNQNIASNEVTRETIIFWKHLALADLITGINPAADPAVSAWGETHPTSRLRGGYHAMYFNPVQCTTTSAPNINCGGAGHSIRLQNVMNAAPSIATAGQQPISPLQAAKIDRKIDDGLPQRGSVQAEDGDGGGARGCDAAVYNEQMDQKNCFMFFNIE
jgi:prepilin-type N-terminal cleavage/methylation domain-containing protein